MQYKCEYRDICPSRRENVVKLLVFGNFSYSRVFSDICVKQIYNSFLLVSSLIALNNDFTNIINWHTYIITREITWAVHVVFQGSDGEGRWKLCFISAAEGITASIFCRWLTAAEDSNIRDGKQNDLHKRILTRRTLAIDLAKVSYFSLGSIEFFSSYPQFWKTTIRFLY